MPKKKKPAVPEEFLGKIDIPEISPDPIPDIEPLPVEPPVQIPKEAPTPDIPDEQPEISPGNSKGPDKIEVRNQ